MVHRVIQLNLNKLDHLCYKNSFLCISLWPDKPVWWWRINEWLSLSRKWILSKQQRKLNAKWFFLHFFLRISLMQRIEMIKTWNSQRNKKGFRKISRWRRNFFNTTILFRFNICVIMSDLGFEKFLQENCFAFFVCTFLNVL